MEHINISVDKKFPDCIVTIRDGNGEIIFEAKCKVATVDTPLDSQSISAFDDVEQFGPNYGEMEVDLDIDTGDIE